MRRDKNEKPREKRVLEDAALVEKILELIDDSWCLNRDYYAAVAVLYHPLERKILLIERREIEGDPWSGHIAFPGGRRERNDLNSYYTSLRELFEEIPNIDPGKIIHLGAMKTYVTRDVYKVIPHIYISRELFQPKWSETEIKRASWVDLDDLREIECPLNKRPRCFRTSIYEKIIWGLTGRILGDIIDALRE